MHVVLTGPAPVRELADLLGRAPETLPAGLPGTPVVGLAKELVRRGLDVTVVTCAEGVDEEVVADGRLRVRVGPYRARHRARDAFRVERDHVVRAIADEAPDVVHAHWTYEFALGALDSGAPALVTVRDWAPAILRYQPDPYRLVRLGMQLAVLRRAEALSVTSPYLRRRVGPVARVRPVLVPNAIEDGVLDPSPSLPRRSLAAPGAAPRLVAVNNGWSRRKNVGVLLDAFALIRTVRPAAELELIGAGYGPGEAAERWAGARGVAAGVRFTGSVPAAHVRDAVRRADVFVHPSREESFGLVLVEAMAQGIPAVGGSRSGAVPWVLDGGRAGVLADIASPTRLAEAVLTILADDERRAHLARSGWEHAQRFTLSAVAERYLERYEELRR
jgi:glycosyltransferase involved in cell wall biosynthesis